MTENSSTPRKAEDAGKAENTAGTAKSKSTAGAAKSKSTAGTSLWQRLSTRTGIIAGISLAFVLGVCLGAGASQPAAQPDTGHDHAAAEEGAWTCPMHPQIRQNGPGSCPICGMDLVPVDNDDSSGDDAAHRITLTERARTLARVRTTEVELVPAASRVVRLLGRVDYDETRLKSVTAWTGGRIDRLLVSATGQTIRPGQVIARLYSPEIYAAHSDLIQAARQVRKLAGAGDMARTAAQSALEASRQRLRLLGVPDRAIARMEKATSPQRNVAIHTPFGGTVIERLVSEGNYVSAGTALYRVADLSRLWVQLDAYETDTPLLNVGDPVTLEVTGLPGQRFRGTISFIDPVVDAKKRTSRVRVEVDNPEGVLRPGMFAEAVIEATDEAAGMLVIPDTAPLYTGQRSVVYVEVPGSERPTYEAREVELGPRAGAFYPVLSGLELGERVVIQGAFVLDADLQIKGGRSMMTRDDDPTRRARQPIAEVPEPLAERLAAVLSSYLAVQEALAADDLDKARAAGRELADAVTHAGIAVPDSLAPQWDEMGGELGAYARYLAGTDSLGPARKAFEELSEQVLAMLQRFGNPSGEAVKVAYCPMAFDGRGASWVQRKDSIANSYFGTDMFSCGEIRNDIEPGAHLHSSEPDDQSPAPESTSKAHTGHAH